MARAWMVWVQTFSAAVTMAALAIWCAPFVEDKKVGEVRGGGGGGGGEAGDKEEEGGGTEFVKGIYEELKEACEMIRENGSKRSQGVLVGFFFFVTLGSMLIQNIVSASNLAQPGVEPVPSGAWETAFISLGIGGRGGYAVCAVGRTSRRGC